MRRILITSAMCAVVFMATSALAHQAAGAATDSQNATDKSDSHDKFTLDGQAALWTVAIKPDKTADFEKVLEKLHHALTTSAKLERRRQGEGWMVLRLKTPLPDGNVAYVHDVRSVVPEADYSVMRILYEAYPDERRELYDLYRGAFVKNVALATGSVVIDMTSVGAGAAATSPAASSAPPASTLPAPSSSPSTPVVPQPSAR